MWKSFKQDLGNSQGCLTARYNDRQYPNSMVYLRINQATLCNGVDTLMPRYEGRIGKRRKTPPESPAPLQVRIRRAMQTLRQCNPYEVQLELELTTQLAMSAGASHSAVGEYVTSEGGVELLQSYPAFFCSSD